MSNKSKRKNKPHKKTRRRRRQNITGKITKEKDGWVSIDLWGEPYERGFAHGYLLWKQLKNINEKFDFFMEDSFGSTIRSEEKKQDMTQRQVINKIMEYSNRVILPVVQQRFPLIWREIRGISAGARARGVYFSVEKLVAFNGIMNLFSRYLDGNILRCSAFIATGDATEKGDIVMAHNSHTNFVEGPFFWIKMTIYPDTQKWEEGGIPFTMQSSAGCVSSITDWFINSSGIIGCETTIAGIRNKPLVMESPIFCRIRMAMQYGKTINDCVAFIKANNAGDYACSWLLGDINTGEIARYEIGVYRDDIRRTNNGIFIGMNGTIDPIMRIQETQETGMLDDVTGSVGARNIRLQQLVMPPNGEYNGKLNITTGKQIIADHYDVYKGVNEPNSRSICKHVEYDDGMTNPEINKPFYLAGALDGKVVNTEMARKLQFWGRAGSSCGREFSVKKYISLHPEFEKYRKYLTDIPSKPWTKL